MSDLTLSHLSTPGEEEEEEEEEEDEEEEEESRLAPALSEVTIPYKEGCQLVGPRRACLDRKVPEVVLGRKRILG
jgi:hypothetical protein